MKKMMKFVFFLLFLFVFSGCQQAEKKQDVSAAGAGRKERLVANENLGLKNELLRCQAELKKARADVDKAYQQCEQEKKQNEETISWLLNDLPADLLKEVERLTKENEELQKKLN